MQVCVSILPQKFFVKQVAGDLVDVEVLVKPGASPATYTPKPSQLKTIQNAQLFFTIGVAFEKNWLPRFLSINPDIKLIDTTKGIKKQSLNHHEHNDKKEHTGLDPHIWLAPMLVVKQVDTITKALIQKDPKHADTYRKNSEHFIKKLKEIDAQIKEILKDVKQKEFIVFHPSFGYFANAYGLTQIAIEKEGKEPSLKYIAKVINFAKEHNIQTIFASPQFSQKSAKQIAKHINANVKTINPLAENWDENILKIAKSFHGNN
jgi:zinc transport system substrate-binding protein